jgi:hypothetical protein
MESWQIALLIKPLALFLFLFLVAMLAHGIKKILPEGKLKRFLFFSWRV